MSPVDIVGLLIPVTYLVMLAIEKWRPARAFPSRRGWTWVGIGFLLSIGTVSTVVPLLIDPQWLAAHRWLDGTGLGVAGGVVVGYVVLSALGYAFHRTHTKLRRPTDLGHDARHVPQSRWLRGPLRVRAAGRPPRRRDARVARRHRAAQPGLGMVGAPPG